MVMQQLRFSLSFPSRVATRLGARATLGASKYGIAAMISGSLMTASREPAFKGDAVARRGRHRIEHFASCFRHQPVNEPAL
jgi:hypothetical protein